MVDIPFLPYEPDKGPFSGTSIDTVVNALPLANGWGPMPATTVFTLALPTECKGAWWYRSTAGTFNMIAATQDKLFKLNSSTLAWDHVSRIAADTVTNGTFAVDANWTKETNVTISAGVAHFTATPTLNGIYQAQALVAGTTYKITYTISGYSAGGVAPFFSLGSFITGTNRTANGTYTEYLTATGASTIFGFIASGTTTLNIDNVTLQALANYTGPATGELWTAAIFGTNFYVTNLNDPLQFINIDSGTNFANATGSPPQAKYIAVVGDFVFLVHLKVGATAFPRKWQHCAVNDPTDWSISGVSGDSDDQEIPDGDDLVGILAMPGSNARLFQRKARRQLVFSPGSNPVFQQIDMDAPSEGAATRGVIAPHAIVPIGSSSYIVLNETGWYLGDEFTPIGAERIDVTFLADVDRSKLAYVQAAADPFKKILWIRYQDGSGTYKMKGYNWQLDRWTHSDIPAQLLVSSATPGVVLDSLTSTLDSYTEPLDSSFWQGGQVTFGCFRSDNKLYLFAGAKAAATIETSTIELSPDSTSEVTGAMLKANISTYTMQLGSSMLPDEALTWSSAQMRSSRTGMTPFRSDAKYHRFRINISAGGSGTHVHAIAPIYQPSGVEGGP